jgi:Zn-dependent metalloprotease
LVHYGKDFTTAFWYNGKMVFGDGSIKMPVNSIVNLERVGYLFAAGVIEHTMRFDFGQSGTVSRHFMNISSCLVTQYLLRQPANQADWWTEKDLFGKKPRHMKDYIEKPKKDNWNVMFLNTGIPDHAFYLAATKIGGFAWEKTGLIWYIAFRDKLRGGASFQDLGDSVYRVAGDLYGKSGIEQKAIAQAWNEVGIRVNTS